MQNFSFNSASSLHIHKLQFIDNLRALAILMVILHHAGEVFPGANYLRLISPFGRYGVQLFFVMSAFTLCYTGAGLTLQPINLLGFYTKRLFRIAPMYYLAIIGYCYAAFATRGMHGLTPLGDFDDYNKANMLSNLFFVHGLYPSGNNSIVPGGWSIGCEMLFYLVFPFLLILTRIAKGYLLAFQIISIISVGGLLIVARLTGHHGLGGGSSFAYYFVGNQMPAFLMGISLFFFWHSDKYFSILILASIIGLTTLYLSDHLGWSSQVWIIQPMIFGICSCLLAKIFSKIHLGNIFAGIGKVSYSMYISHFIFVWLVAQLLKKTNFKWGENVSATLLFFIVAVLSYFFSRITFKFIETPFIKLGKNIAKSIWAANKDKEVGVMKFSKPN